MFLAAAVLTSTAACQREDTLSALPNDGGTAMLKDRLIGSDARVICVARSLQDPCDPRSAEVYVQNVPALGDVRAEWISDKLVLVTISAGNIRKFVSVSRDGQVTLRRRPVL
jgi:hypothetical protein